MDFSQKTLLFSRNRHVQVYLVWTFGHELCEPSCKSIVGEVDWNNLLKSQVFPHIHPYSRERELENKMLLWCVWGGGRVPHKVECRGLW